jgi:hypothetical protein
VSLKLPQVPFIARGSNMQQVWDSDTIERANRTPDLWPANLFAMDSPESRKAAMAAKIEDWATESILASREAYQDPATGQRRNRGPSW